MDAQQADSLSDLLIFATPERVLMRGVSAPRPLRRDVAHGYAAELATHDAATVWGLPDFVFRPAEPRTGPGSRELGDGLLIVGELGIVLQIKSREHPSGNPSREAMWLAKKTVQALRQGAGTIRRLRMAPQKLTNRRGRTIELDARQMRWLTVVVLDHDDPPSGVVPPADPTSVIMLRRDWQFLFDQLKSTHVVADYCRRVAGGAIELGEEPTRYYELADADVQASPGKLDSKLIGAGRQVSKPMLPLAPAASEDLDAHLLVRHIFEAIALSPPREFEEADRLCVLAELDRLPISHREDIGRFLLDAMDEVEAAPEGYTVWKMRSMRGPAGGSAPRVRGEFGAAQRDDPGSIRALGSSTSRRSARRARRYRAAHHRRRPAHASRRVRPMGHHTRRHLGRPRADGRGVRRGRETLASRQQRELEASGSGHGFELP